MLKKNTNVNSKTKAIKIAHKYRSHIPGFVRETGSSYHVRITPNTKFNRETFHTKVVNKGASIVYGKLKKKYQNELSSLSLKEKYLK